VRAAYDRLIEVDRPEVWITLRREVDVLGDAAEVERRLADGADLPLAGLTVAVKDNVDVGGLPTTAACAAYGYIPDESAPAVARLVNAGAVVLGKTNLDQFATGLVGTRSPYGAVRNAAHPELVSGGSSSGSAVAVALGVADIGVGTDTAGSGRVPAAFNGIVGIKPTLGLVPSRGVVPAARPYDTVSVFARTLAEAQAALTVMTGPDELDPASRDWPSDVRLAGSGHQRIAVPDDAGLALCSPAVRSAHTDSIRRLSALGYTIETVDISLFLEAATLLYGSALVAERYAAVGSFVEKHLDACDPTVARLVLDGGEYGAADLAQAQATVARLRLSARDALAGFDALMLPTTTEHPSIVAVREDPVDLNARLGTYTNFVNLLDLAGVAVPVGPAEASVGVTLIGAAFTDQVLLDVAADLVGETILATYPPVSTELVVFGAHMRGQPLNDQLRRLGARFVAAVETAPEYRMIALSTTPSKPGVQHVRAGGAALAGERWALSAAGLGAFLAALPEPMQLGQVRLADGTSCVGFFCAASATGEDITAYGSWPAYLARSG
jgi:allophanate hydrolase